MFYVRRCIVVLAVVLVSAAAIPAHAQQKMPDSGLFTNYFSGGNPATTINWVTCGSTAQSEGCYESGMLGPFTNACSIVQSVPAPLNFNTVLRYIYVMDAGSRAGGATLTIYKRIDVISPTYDTTTITQLAVVALPTLAAGPGATCATSQNPTNVYAGTYQGPNIAVINKTNFSVSSFAGSENLSALTADYYGFVTISWGSGFPDDSVTIGPNGQTQQSGGGSYWLINPINGLNPDSLPRFDAAQLPQLGYHLKSTR